MESQEEQRCLNRVSKHIPSKEDVAGLLVQHSICRQSLWAFLGQLQKYKIIHIYFFSWSTEFEFSYPLEYTRGPLRFATRSH